MTARNDILAAIRAAAVPPAPSATVPPASAHFDADQLRQQFLERLGAVSGMGMLQPAHQSMDTLLQALLGTERTNAMVLRGHFAVAENGAVYVDAANLDARHDVVRCHHLVVIVPWNAIVATMHEAMPRIPDGSTCGWFLSGPSKTADIEQSLVIGAQGSRTHRVIFERSE